ncbi:hydantoinase/oxoprolinase family protein [Methylopila sp. Yamaguchi]|uniref:hydantoinase/oxoprolinase family protein n=1 Tax=Methylopila sp. Yamaguchi TaxID=1437817 RepID=UPI00135A5C53|nr:hydantoinase/oxoprolinase family protein [Methylopila sp. Yamaguchi]
MLVGVDVGGTFTDLVAADDGALRFVKTPSTPDDPARGVMDALELLACETGQSLEDLLPEVDVFIHGTTVATNALVERKGAKLGLITTKGFRDLIELREGARQERYALRTDAPEPLIERPLRLEVRERVDAAGAVREPLDEVGLDAALAQLRAAGAESVVVCLLHAHRRPEHERAVRAAIDRAGWTPFISLSHEALGREGEYDRLSTAAVNAYVGPSLKAYLERLFGELSARGVRTPVFVMQSTGGVLPIADAGQRAVGAVTSGPAGGAMAAALFARTLGFSDVVTYDTGGTTTDVAVIQNGAPVERVRTDVADLRIAAPAIAIDPIGIGGGSIARIDAGGVLAVGPESAGAAPGPACFLKGGVRATLTDANLALGLISPDTFLGGRMPLSVDLARDAIARDVAQPLGLSVEEAAWAVHVLATSGVTEGVRLATVRRGRDPRDFALLSFGGAGGLHAHAAARELRIPTVVVPRMASVLSALGFLAADVRQDLQVSVDKPIRALGPSELQTIFDGMEREGRVRLARTGLGSADVTLRRTVDCRYDRQTHAIPVVIGEAEPAALEDAFTAAYRSLYGHAHDTEPGVVDVCRLSLFGALPKLTLPRAAVLSSPDPSAAKSGEREVFLGRWTVAGVYRFDDLAAGMQVAGPAIIESASTTVLVQEGGVASVDETGSLRIGELAS